MLIVVSRGQILIGVLQKDELFDVLNKKKEIKVF
jgi:hypothetical protein